MKIQLLSFPGCPNAAAAREALRRVLAAREIDAPIEEVDTSSAATPEHLRGWGSPTVLIDGVDVAGERSPGEASCRLYRDAAGRIQGTPPVVLIEAALIRMTRSESEVRP